MQSSKLVYTLLLVFTLTCGPQSQLALAADKSAEPAVPSREVEYLQVTNPRVPLDATQRQLLQAHRSFDHILVVFSDLDSYVEMPWTDAEKRTVKKHLKDIYQRVPGLLINAARLGPVILTKAGDKSFLGETTGNKVCLSDQCLDERPTEQLFTVVHELAHAVDFDETLAYGDEWQKLVSTRLRHCREGFRKATTWQQKVDCLRRFRIPSHYALTDSGELLAEYVAAVVLCPDNNCPADIRAFIQKHVLSKQKAPDAYERAVHRIVTDRDAASWSKAEALCDEWLKKLPDDLNLHRLRMHARVQIGRLAGCIEDAKKVLELAQPRLAESEKIYAECYTFLGYCYFNLKDYDHCLPYLDKAMACDKEYSSNQVLRGYVYLFLKRPALALKDFEEVLSRDPESLNAQLGRARVYARMQMKEKAYAELERLRKVERPAKEVFQQLAGLEQSEGKTRLAQHHIRVAASLAQ